MDAVKNLDAVLNAGRILPTTASLTRLPQKLPAGVDIYQQGEDRIRQSKSDLVRRIEFGISKFLADADVRLEFIKQEPTGGIVARVVHNPSGKIVREIPVISIFRFVPGVNQKV
jgi:uncharacterized FlaG/YvyC family protein